jgi:membrane protein implicated in regulation of membrane protease activity
VTFAAVALALVSAGVLVIVRWKLTVLGAIFGLTAVGDYVLWRPWLVRKTRNRDAR